MMAMTHDQELTCDEVHALIDQFAGMKQRGEDPSHLFPLVQRHLDMCSDCREKYEALLAALEVTLSSI
jgi:predicted anti-sigma-YlaC factor YlaD